MKKSSARLFMNAAIVAHNLRLGLSEAPKYVAAIKDEVVYKKIGDLNRWYTRVIGLDEVKAYQDRVVKVQEKLLATQERRREIGLSLADVRRKSNELQDQLHKVKRQEDLQRFLDLMKDETVMLKQEQEMSERFASCDREEREIFTAFTNAIRDSHEKQRAQLEYTKYFGLILSITGSFLAFMYSTLKKHDLKQYIEEHLDKAGVSEPVLRKLLDNEKQLNEIVRYVNSDNERVLSAIGKSHGEIAKLLLLQQQRIGGGKAVITDGGSGLISGSRKNFNEMPDGEKLLWFSVVSLVGLIILRKFFN